jgi:DNA topoisomerase-2
VAASTRGGVKVYLNNKRVPIKNFKEYVDFFIKDMEDATGNDMTTVYETCNERWEVAVAVSENGFQQFSFVNSIATTKGGKHIDYVSKLIEGNLLEV